MKKLRSFWNGQPVWMRFALVAVLLVGAGVGVWVGSATTISGTVRCESGRQVSGVWVEGRLSHIGSHEVNSGFATIRRNTDVSTFSWTRHLGSPVEFHVGCGVEASGPWQSVGHSPKTSLTHLSVVCFDDRGQLSGQLIVCTVTRLL
jgi:hypothetical protein